MALLVFFPCPALFPHITLYLASECAVIEGQEMTVGEGIAAGTHKQLPRGAEMSHQIPVNDSQLPMGFYFYKHSKELPPPPRTHVTTWHLL